MTPSVAKTHKPSSDPPKTHHSQLPLPYSFTPISGVWVLHAFHSYNRIIESCETYFWKCGFRSIRSIMNLDWAMGKLKTVKMHMPLH